MAETKPVPEKKPKRKKRVIKTPEQKLLERILTELKGIKELVDAIRFGRAP